MTAIPPKQELKRTRYSLPNELAIGSTELAAARIRAALAKRAAFDTAVALRAPPRPSSLTR
jgi:hypothetical protein